MAVKKDDVGGKWYFYGKYYTLQGDLKQYKKRGFATKSIAKQEEQVFLLAQKEYIPRVSLNELYEEFIAYSYGRKKETTVNKDIQIYRLHIVDYFGSKAYKNISVKDIIRWQNDLLRVKKLTPANINSITKTFNKLFGYAAKVYGYTGNPIRMAGRLKETKFTYVTWDESQFLLFYKQIEEQRYRVAFRVLYFTGIRRGELLALTWNDFDGSSLTISKTCSHVTGGYVITDPKTHNSNRTVTLDQTTLDMLVQYKESIQNNDGFNDNWYIFGYSVPMPFNALGRMKDKCSKQANLPSMRIHDFRHSHISLLINNNIPLPAIASRAGDTIDTIIKTYAHLFEKSNQELMDFLNQY
ncbi:MAG: site-specific integrase [Cellulosilyticaceae bacterium]